MADDLAQLQPMPREVPNAQGWGSPWLPLGLPCSLAAIVRRALAVRPCPVCTGGAPTTPHVWPPGSHWPPLCPDTENDMPLLLYDFCTYMKTLFLTLMCKKSKSRDLFCNFG